jgi:hypothetical protein
MLVGAALVFAGGMIGAARILSKKAIPHDDR